MRRPVALLTGPRRLALSGVSTHVNLLLASALGEAFTLVHFEVGREGRNEGRLARAGRMLTSPIQLARAVLKHRAEIVHINTSLTVRAYWRDLVYMIVARLCGARVLYQVHGGAGLQGFCHGFRVCAAFVRATLRMADVIVVLSSSERDAYQSFGVTPRVLAFPNCVDSSAYAGLTRVHQGAERPLRLLYLGRFIREKGLFELIEALRIARRAGVAVQLSLAGDGPEEARLRRLVAAYPLEQVTFAGPVRGAEKIALLQWADVLALPSYSERLPYALLESMAAGVPAIATRVGAIPDVVADGVNGLLVEPRAPDALAAAIARIAADRALLERLSEASRATIAARYSIGRLVAQLGCVYAILCERRANQYVARS